MQLWTRRVLIGCAAASVLLALGVVVAMGDRAPVQALFDHWLQDAPNLFARYNAQAHALIAEGYLRTPETMLAVAAALVLPVVGLLVALLAWIGRKRADRRLVLEAAHVRPPATLPPGPHAKAWLEIAGQGGSAVLALKGEICRIGAGGDNDIELTGAALQPAHALIRRTADAEFLIIDITGEAGPGLTVNGGRFLRCALRDGDLIDLGGTTMTFRREIERHGRSYDMAPPRPAMH